MTLLIAIASAFCVSLLLTGIIIPKILLIAFRRHLFDEVDERKIHKGAIPRLGGIAFVPAIFFSLMLVVGFSYTPNSEFWLPEFHDIEIRPLAFSFCGVMLLFLVGIADDLIGVMYRAKFVVQIFSATLLILGGVWIDNLHGFCGIYDWPDYCGCTLTVLVAVFFVNAINLIDGIDGLASGLSAVALTCYGVFFCFMGDTFNAMIAFATLGSLLQFFYYNVFGSAKNGKKIFMGDTGALCIGFMLTYLSITIARVPEFNFTVANPIIVAFAPMLVPCLDVLRVFWGRIRRGVSPFLPDRTHIHHKLLALDYTTPHAMISILCISAGAVVYNLLLSPYLNAAVILLLDIVLWVLYNLWLTHRIHKRGISLH